jgi:transcriptional regulator with XRE-family HTH domain
VDLDPTDKWSELGQFIREQRATARLSLRRLAELSGISNPYLSQIERGLRHPSAEILQQIAKALAISSETLYVQAGILDPPLHPVDLTRSIVGDPNLHEDQKQALVQIYRSFLHENQARAAAAGNGSGDGAGASADASDGPGAGDAPEAPDPVANGARTVDANGGPDAVGDGRETVPT